MTVSANGGISFMMGVLGGRDGGGEEGLGDNFDESHSCQCL